MSGRVPESPVGRHWVVIETGANQAYIFASNRQAVNVGASELIWRVGHVWAEDAVREVGAGAELVVAASGKALLLVDDPETGRAIIRAVTTRALDEAPGLEVWGVVDGRAITDDRDVGPALARAHRLQAAWRGRRPATALRHPTLPFIQPCHFSGQPATTIRETDTERYPISEAVDRAWRMRDEGRKRMVRQLGPLGDQAVVRPDGINNGVSADGWVAVMHADGNGIGAIFRNLHRAYEDDGRGFLTQLQAFSKALDDVTAAALRSVLSSLPDRTDWLLPLVLGGDDVTVVMDARVAYDVTVDFLREFARQSAADPTITEVVRQLRDYLPEPHPAGLTACAGIAYVKPRYAFSEAYQLAEELCASAKRVKEIDPRCGALDFHVLHDSVGRDLAEVRAPLTVRTLPQPWRRSDDGGGSNGDGRLLRLWAGPVVVADRDVPLGDWAEAHREEHLREAIVGLRGIPALDVPPVISRTGQHLLRQALLRGGAEIDRARAQVLAAAADREKADEYLAQHLVVPEPGSAQSAEVANPDAAGAAFSRLLSAMDLVDMATGTASATDSARPTRKEALVR